MDYRRSFMGITDDDNDDDDDDDSTIVLIGDTGK